ARLPEVMAATLHRNGMADAEAHQESIGKGLGQGLVARGHGPRIAGIDVGDATGNHDSPGAREQDSGVGKLLAAHGLPDPDGAVAQLLQLRGGLLRLGRRLEIEAGGPDPAPAQVHLWNPFWHSGEYGR